MKWYRLTDAWGEPYYSGYNETDLYELAESMYSLWDSDGMRDDESFYGKTQGEAIWKIYSLLKEWERELAYFVEESYFPFPPEWEYGRDDKGHIYPREVILKYANTRTDLGNYDDDLLIEFVWFGSHKSERLEEILDEFSMINWREDLDDYLNNILFNTFDEIVNEIWKWFNEEKGITISRMECAELASEFVDNKELYDISYD